MAEMEQDSGASVVRLHPGGVPDLRGLHAIHAAADAEPVDSEPAPGDSAQPSAPTDPPFAFYADVEESADSVRVVLVAATQGAEPLHWTQVSVYQVYGSWRDSVWTSGAQQPPLQVRTGSPAPGLPPEQVRFLAVRADSLDRTTAWRYARMDSVQVRMREPGCTLAYRLSRADLERLRRSLRLYDLMAAERL